MTGTLAHRGPDDAGVWVDAEAEVSLGHRRLSIQDLSAEGHQPMVSGSARYVLVFNGEVYNFRELRAELEDSSAEYGFRSNSDTEVMLAAFERWGVREAVSRFNGMFAFAVWDRRERLLVLARDRMGEKPLYYAWAGGGFLFGSELKSLQAHPGFEGRVDRGSVGLFMRHGYVPAPYSIYERVRKLPPGTILTVRNGWTETAPSPYWSAKEVAERGCAHRGSIADEEAVERLETLLADSVRLRLVADVPLGAFLSGGIDSSAIVALMQKNSGTPIKTYTIGFQEQGYNEAQQAKAVARHLGTEHTELYVTAAEAMSVVPQLPLLYDEPFADSSQIPTFLVSRLARRHVKVALTGDGGDEVFGGYTRYLWTQSIWRAIGWMPGQSRRLFSSLLRRISPNGLEYFHALGRLPKALQQSNPAGKLDKLARVLLAKSPEHAYRLLVSHWDDMDSVTRGRSAPPTLLTQPERWAEVSDLAEKMMFLDTVTYLPDDILVKLDRASMGVGLEARVPLLDHRVVELAWQLPRRMKIRKGQGKWLLRQVLDKHVPRNLVDRPKTGFGVPIHEWLRGPLRAWAEELLDPQRLRREGFFNPGPIRRRWAEHLSGRRDHGYALWNALMFQAWLEQNCTTREHASMPLHAPLAMTAGSH